MVKGEGRGGGGGVFDKVIVDILVSILYGILLRGTMEDLNYLMVMTSKQGTK